MSWIFFFSSFSFSFYSCWSGPCSCRVVNFFLTQFFSSFYYMKTGRSVYRSARYPPASCFLYFCLITILQIGLPMEENFSILCHHISLHQFLIMMEIKGTNLQVPVRLPNLFQRKFKQSPVIRLKFHNAIFFQNLLISGQKLPGSKSPFGMSCLRPRIREIQIDPVNLILFKIRSNLASTRINTRLEKLSPCSSSSSLFCKARRSTLSYISIPIKFLSGCNRAISIKKRPFPYANLKKKRPLLPKNALPLSFKLLWLINHPITLQNRILRPGNIT